MEIQTFIQSILKSIHSSSVNTTRRRVSTLLKKVNLTESFQEFLEMFYQQLEEHQLEVSPTLTGELPADTWLHFSLISDENDRLPANVPQTLPVVEDFFKYLFDFGSPEEYERFQAALDSFSPVSLFIVPQEENFYSDVIEKVLSFELLRKRQYRNDFKVGDIGQMELGQLATDPSGNDLPVANIWSFYDLYNFDQKNMEQVILGENGASLLQSEKFTQKFNQLALYANKYYSDQFFIVFNCPSQKQVAAKQRQEVMDSLIAQVNQKFPYVFTLRCKFARQSEIPAEALHKIYQHFRFLLELPHYPIDESLPLASGFSLLQKAQKMAETQLLLHMQPEVFNLMQWNYENDEFLHLQYFALNTLHKRYGYALPDINTNANSSRYHVTEDYEFAANPDVMVKNEIIVEIKTLGQKIRDKNIHIDLVSSIKSESRGWKKNLKEFWLVVPGFEIARNYYQLKKIQQILQSTLKKSFNSQFKIVLMAPDYANHELVPVHFDEIALPTHQVVMQAPQLPSTTALPTTKALSFDQVKGLHEEKAMLKDLIQLQDEHHSLGLGGIIFYGLSGCGKTYLSNAFASELGRYFFSFSPADIQSMWIGQTQKNIKDIFSQAQSKSPSLLFMDELESIGFSRNNQQAHTDQKATINQLLIEMNNIDESNVLVVGATNKISQLDSALKRSGRFDLKIPIFPPNEQERAEIFHYYLELLNKELAQKQHGIIEVEQVYFNYLGEESVGMTSSDIKTLMNRLRIDNLLKKPQATNADLLVTRVKKFIQEGQRTLSKDDVRGFIDECQRNDQYSPKIEFLLDEWNL
ncbi:ATP-binding protein [uncultured Microscilla sp.]|uniref:ATP-binding protein n=1 Tax=uncultured Microscilla sp. TaxID=432653 RepID=UPI00261BA114|nr:ATP-binding protein [uncultured Microscilla sp.]